MSASYSKQISLIFGLIAVVLSVDCGGGTIGPKPASGPSPIAGSWFVQNQFSHADLSFIVNLTENADGSISARFNQGSNGTFCWEPEPIGPAPTVAGKRKGDSVALTLSFPPSVDFDAMELDIDGTLSADRQTVSGTFSLNGSCDNPSGPSTWTRIRP